MIWTVIFSVIEAIVANPLVKPFEEAELTALRTQYASNPVVLAILNGVAAGLGL